MARKMAEKKNIKKYVFTVEGETEAWYFEWLQHAINSSGQADFNVSIKAVVKQQPLKYAKSHDILSTPLITHICDVESNDEEHIQKFKEILDQLKKAKLQKKIQYNLGYSNFTFELWMVLHKQELNSPLTNRSQYIAPINRAFNEHFEDLHQYKHEANFKRCLSKLSLEDVKGAIVKARNIMIRKADEGQFPNKYKGFSYYSENPALSIWESVNKILHECGITTN